MNTAYNKRGFCDPDEVLVPVHSIGLNRGYVGFDFLKIVNGRLFYGDRHMKRFFRTLELMRLMIPQTVEEVIEILEEIAKRSEDSHFGLKLFAIPLDSEAADPIPATLSIVPVPIPIRSGDFYERGSKLVTFEYARFLPKQNHRTISLQFTGMLRLKGKGLSKLCFTGKEVCWKQPVVIFLSQRTGQW